MLSLKKSTVIAVIFTAMTVQAFKLGPQKKPVVFAFDIHGVLMRLKKSEVISTAFTEFIKQPSLLLQVGDFFNGNAADHAPMRRMFNCQQPICETWQVARQLKMAKYPLYIFSNIGELTLQELKEKFPDLFSIFDDFHAVPSNNKTLRKPNKEAFVSFKALVHQKYPKDTHIIFIDDDHNNIAAARKAGLTAIRFNSATQLKKELALFF